MSLSLESRIIGASDCSNGLASGGAARSRSASTISVENKEDHCNASDSAVELVLAPAAILNMAQCLYVCSSSGAGFDAFCLPWNQMEQRNVG